MDGCINTYIHAWGVGWDDRRTIEPTSCGVSELPCHGRGVCVFVDLSVCLSVSLSVCAYSPVPLSREMHAMPEPA